MTSKSSSSRGAHAAAATPARARARSPLGGLRRLIVRATAAACGLPPVPRELLEGALCAGDSLHAWSVILFCCTLLRVPASFWCVLVHSGMFTWQSCSEVHSSDAVDALLAGDARVVLFVPGVHARACVCAHVSWVV